MGGAKKQGEILDLVLARGGLRPGVATEVAKDSGVPEAHVFGAASFYHLLDRPDIKVRVCLGLSCQMDGAKAVLEAAKAAGLPAEGCSCLAACDRPPVVLRDREVLVEVSREDVEAARGDWTQLSSPASSDGKDWLGVIGSADSPVDRLAIHLEGAPDYTAQAYDRAQGFGRDAVIEQIQTSGLQGRGGAGFPAHIKWRAVSDQKEPVRYVVLNADEGEPGTFKDREILLRRPDLVVEGLAIAARAIGAQEIYMYLRGEFSAPWRAVEHAIAQFGDRFGGLQFHLHAGHGAYICGEETALLEALEGKRGMPRLKPPFPTEHGLWQKPTLMHNVETIACVSGIVRHGGEWFRALGKTDAGTKLYCISGHVQRPGVYELPLGVSLDELVEAAGGYVGTLKAFSPGGASSGFLPAAERNRPLDFKSLAEAGSMLGSAGVVVLNDTVDLAWAVRQQLRFFEVESCGQCAPCRIGTRFLREAMDRHLEARGGGAQTEKGALKYAAEAAWEMNEGSICGLGQAAPLPLQTTMRYFPGELGDE